jgi:23S rRNA pseudouridine2604 synthase
MKPIPNDPDAPIRLNKYLAMNGYSTRRGADELIKKRTVFINGEVAVLGDKVSEGDVVELKGKEKPKQYLYFAYNKPAGLMTEDIQRGDISLTKSLIPKGIFPVGRLDKKSHGLIILTNDGRITDRLLNPERTHDKEYIVKTKEKIRANFKEKMEAGIDIEGYMTKPCSVRVKDDHEFSIILTEGKKHQIRRMCVALHNDVVDLKRTRVLNVRLASLAVGSLRKIDGEELEEFLGEIGL